MSAKDYQSHPTQDLIIKASVTRYRLECWQLPDGSHITETLPKELQGHHCYMLKKRSAPARSNVLGCPRFLTMRCLLEKFYFCLWDK